MRRQYPSPDPIQIPPTPSVLLMDTNGRETQKETNVGGGGLGAAASEEVFLVSEDPLMVNVDHLKHIGDFSFPRLADFGAAISGRNKVQCQAVLEELDSLAGSKSEDPIQGDGRRKIEIEVKDLLKLCRWERLMPIDNLKRIRQKYRKLVQKYTVSEI
ncbi:hypothetical protein LWI28_027781 [Acer negundo]|uniref:Uncharacterized protein n=1 Tax=Acer negundo TaxID=4023 RepID=A0AAD5J8S2_ACENE|nr:hypothetical protein LWI28_027781 [Acer negundo]